jgi:hypothetical protein
MLAFEPLSILGTFSSSSSRFRAVRDIHPSLVGPWTRHVIVQIGQSIVSPSRPLTAALYIIINIRVFKYAIATIRSLLYVGEVRLADW